MMVSTVPSPSTHHVGSGDDAAMGLADPIEHGRSDAIGVGSNMPSVLARRRCCGFSAKRLAATAAALARRASAFTSEAYALSASAFASRVVADPSVAVGDEATGGDGATVNGDIMGTVCAPDG